VRLNSLALSNTQVSLAWRRRKGRRCSITSGTKRRSGSYALLATPLDVTGYLDNTVQAGLTYSYRVRDPELLGRFRLQQ